MTKELKNDGWVDVDDISQSYKTTQAFKKVAGHFENKVLKQDFFKSEITRLRDKFHIEISVDANGWDFLADTLIGDGPVDGEIAELCKRFSLDELSFIPVIRYYLHHDAIKYPFGAIGGLCLVEETPGDVNYPIAIRVSPYANKSDIKNFIDEVFDTQIEPLRSRHARKDVSVGEYRQTDPILRKVYNFAYENRNLRRQEISDLIVMKFDKHFDQAEIGKIISLEIKMRKQL